MFELTENEYIHSLLVSGNFESLTSILVSMAGTIKTMPDTKEEWRKRNPMVYVGGTTPDEVYQTMADNSIKMKKQIDLI